MNETRHYFGAYLEIDVKQRVQQEQYRSCKNNHEIQPGDFCPVCGEPVEVKTRSVQEFPVWISDVIGDEWIDVLAHITPPSLYGTGKIIAIGNSSALNDGEWMYIMGNNADIEMKEFPKEREIQKMTKDFETSYRSIIHVLIKSPEVSRIQIKAGYVLDADF